MTKAVYLVSTHGYFDVCPDSGSISTAGRPDTGGQTVYTIELARALGRRGIPTFLVVRWFDFVQPELQEIGPNAWILRLRGGPMEFIRKEELYIHLREISKGLVDFIRFDWHRLFAEADLSPPVSVEPALFHGHYVDGGIVAAQTAHALESPHLFWTSHSLGALKKERLITSGQNPRELERTFHFGQRIYEEGRLIEACQRPGSGMTVTAKTEAGDILRLYERDIGTTAYFIPPGVDTLKFRPRQEDNMDILPRGWPTGEGPIVVMGGRVARTKGFPEALRAFVRVIARNPRARLVLFGGSRPPSSEERAIFEEMDDIRNDSGIARRVFFIGGQPQDVLPAVYRRGAVFLMPSLHEPFGMVALEAAACGVPVIVSAHAGIAGELSDGKDCLIADPNDTEGFAFAMDAILQDPELAARIAKRGLETVNGKYGWDSVAEKHVALWRDSGVLMD